ncbi:a-pheromone receptor PreA [Paecilomyces variotii No. 5]|uniref:A-pheromone receptor PreA n=1 Tax=Byssochlamys spectabilis (strain No. 5 / NBRC 109023) TaxID=1356009 RepID=V5FZ92_BYSSN|nr:a-pheromone receptor PreA [Paecilomyces variotii No. 5]
MADIEYKRAPEAIIIPFLSLLSIILSITPLMWHLRNSNFPAVCLVCWFLINNLFNIVNAFIWPTDNIDSWWSGVGLCDIEVKLMVASYVGIPGALLCIFRHLAEVLDTDRTVLVPSGSQRRKKLAIEIAFCLVVPVLAMITHYFVQKTRYMLYTISGCVNNFDESWVTFVLSYLWPTVICVIAAYYCCLVMYRIIKYNREFGAILSGSRGSSLNKTRFLRLFCMASVMLLAILPTQAYVLYVDIQLSLPWHDYSFTRMHGPEWNTIIKVATHGQSFFDRWIPIGGILVLFVFFGFGKDATSMYRSIFTKLGVDRWLPAKSHSDIYSGKTTSSSGSRMSKLGKMFTWSLQSNTTRSVPDFAGFLFSVSHDPSSSSSTSTTDLEKGSGIHSVDRNMTNELSFFSRLARLRMWTVFRTATGNAPAGPPNNNSVGAPRGMGDTHPDAGPSPKIESGIKVKHVIRQTKVSICPHCGDEIVSYEP